MSEAMRISVTPQLPHMATWAVYLGLAGFTLGLSYIGIRGFRSRVLT
jgi:hypothetical protein